MALPFGGHELVSAKSLRILLGAVSQRSKFLPWRTTLKFFCVTAFQIKRSSIRKGMVMVSPRLNPQASWEFEAEILVLHHPTTISPRYQAMGKCHSIVSSLFPSSNSLRQL